MLASAERKWFALALLCAVQFMVVLDIAIVNVALPSIQTDLGFSQENLQWVISAYALLFGGFLLLGGRLADLLGRRRIFIAGTILFTVSSLLAGRALDPDDDVRRRQGAERGPRRLGRCRSVRRRRGRPARRRPDRRSQLAVDLLRQRADRPRGPWAHPAAARREP